MPLKTYTPSSPGRRSRTGYDFSHLTKKAPEQSLLESLNSTGGRNNRGRMTVRHVGGGHKRKYRIIDFRREKDNIPATVAAIEYDPNRTANIALLHYADGEKRYILAPNGLEVGTKILSGPSADILPGNCLALSGIPVGTMIHNVELRPGKGGQLARSAGVSAQLMAKEGRYAAVRLPSGEVRYILRECRATIGVVGNEQHDQVTIGKAGRQRWMGIRPRNRAISMNPVDHPMGGGQGKTSGGRHPCSPLGLLAKGKKTRSKRKSKKFIITPRKK